MQIAIKYYICEFAYRVSFLAHIKCTNCGAKKPGGDNVSCNFNAINWWRM